MTTKYYYLAMEQKSMLRNQIMEEIVRERAHNYFARKKPIDFWILISPNFLSDKTIQQKISTTNFFLQNSSDLVSENFMPLYCCVISLDVDFLRWIQLRIGSFENLLLGEKASTTSDSDGIFGEINWTYPMNSANTKTITLKNRKNQLYSLL